MSHCLLLSIRRVLVLNKWHADACQTRTRKTNKTGELFEANGEGLFALNRLAKHPFLIPFLLIEKVVRLLFFYCLLREPLYQRIVVECAENLTFVIQCCIIKKKQLLRP